MTEEQIFKNRFPEYCVGDRCLSPYFDLFQIGFEEGENQNKELQEVKAPYSWYEYLFGESIEQTALKHSNDLINSLRGDIDYAKTIIQDLLSNSDEYARQRAMDWLKEE